MKTELQNMLKDCENELNDIDARIQKLPPMDKGRSYLTNYALIKASGTLEYVYRSIIADYFIPLKDMRINNYLDKSIRSSPNSASYDNMSKLLKQFDKTWADNFRDTIQKRADSNKIISSSNSLVINRHSFAHGKAITASFLDIRGYYTDVVEMIKILDQVVGSAGDDTSAT